MYTKTFEVGKWILRRNFNANKLDKAWEGLYQVIKVIGCRAYQLQDELTKSHVKHVERHTTKVIPILTHGDSENPSFINKTKKKLILVLLKISFQT